MRDPIHTFQIIWSKLQGNNVYEHRTFKTTHVKCSRNCPIHVILEHVAVNALQHAIQRDPAPNQKHKQWNRFPQKRFFEWDPSVWSCKQMTTQLQRCLVELREATINLPSDSDQHK